MVKTYKENYIKIHITSSKPNVYKMVALNVIQISIKLVT